LVADYPRHTEVAGREVTACRATHQVGM